MLAYYGSVISENITETPEGFLICKNVPIARTGTQEYLPCEIGLPGEGLINVSRLESEVLVRGALDSAGVDGRRQRRSKYGAKRPKAGKK